jgi:arsenite methyltransferase
VAQAFGYSAEELTSIPSKANMGLSCGNPPATAKLRVGEVVVDLGSGGGLDVFLAAKKVGPTGRAIGIDRTAAMIERARANAQAGGYTNVEFYQATIDNIPLPDASVDCVISNCVLNLTPDKPAVLREIARVLKPGGRVAVTDIALKHDLPEAAGVSLHPHFLLDLYYLQKNPGSGSATYVFGTTLKVSLTHISYTQSFRTQIGLTLAAIPS